MSYDVDTLIENHLYVARDIALREWRTAPHALDREDLLSDAYFGLVDAANRWEAYCAKKQYDPNATQYFKVFAGLRIRGSIRDQIRREDWATRTLRTKSKKLRDAGLDEGVPLEELAVKTDMTITEIHKVNARMALRPVSLDYLNSRNTSEKETTDRSVDLKNAVDTESESFTNEMTQTFTNAVNLLPEDQKLIIVFFYYSQMSVAAIAEELHLTEATVTELHFTAATAIKDHLLVSALERG